MIAESLPRFFNHASARSFLKEKYGKYFVLYATDEMAADKIYHYHLVQDKERYLEWRDKKAAMDPVDDNQYKNTYQTIEITAGGKLSVWEESEAVKEIV